MNRKDIGKRKKELLIGTVGSPILAVFSLIVAERTESSFYYLPNWAEALVQLSIVLSILVAIVGVVCASITIYRLSGRDKVLGVVCLIVCLLVLAFSSFVYSFIGY